MAVRKKARPVPLKPAPGTETETPAARPEAPSAESESRAQKKTRPWPRQRPRRAKMRARTAVARKPHVARPKAAARRHRGRYSNTDRRRILAAAAKGGLTALQVQERFGVKPATYYSWRKKVKVTRKRAARLVARPVEAAPGLADVVRAGVQEQLRVMLPEIVRAEVAAYLAKVFGKDK